MTVRFGIVASCALFALGGAADADCAAELATIESGAVETAGGEVFKDGSMAPLQEGGVAPAGASEEPAAVDAGEDGRKEPQGAIAKDGSLAPLEGEAGGAAADVAMSVQDVEAQQRGGMTAMAAAEQEGGGPPTFAGREEALSAAREALASGDEDACQEAIEAARVL